MIRATLLLFALTLVGGPAQAAGAPAARILAPCDTVPWFADGGQTDCRFGTVARAGDVNGDGYDDVLIGAYNYSDGETHEGRVAVYHGGPSGLSSTPSWTAESNQAGATLGDKLSGAGDVNGDGYDDIIVGAGLYDHGETDEGAAFVYLGSPTGLAATPAWMAEGDQAYASFGACVGAAGDVNGDGYDDVIVGAWLYDHGEQNEGRAFVYLGSPTGLSTSPVWTGESNSVGAVYGYFVAGAGDVNGDGYDDIVVGARRFSGNGISKEGRVYAYYGSPTGPSPTPSWIHDGGQAGGEFGATVNGAGDVNGDGYDDVVVGAFRTDHPETDEGMAFVFLGGPTGLAQTPAWSTEGDVPLGWYGYHAGTAGDVNGDGYDDLVLSAATYPVNGLAGAGRAYLYLGSPHGLSTTPAWIQDADQAGAQLGDAVSTAGDVNGDGYSDWLVGALYRDGAYVDEGRAYLFYGCGNRPAAVEDRAPSGPRLEVLGPNPSTGRTALAYTLPAPGAARLALYDLSGRVVAELLHARVGAGRHVAFWNGRGRDAMSLPAGAYFARLETISGTRTLVLVHLR